MSTESFSYTLEAFLALTEAPDGGFVLDIQGQQIAIDNVLRFLPGKRLVGKATIDGKTVLAKCFLGSSAERHIKRELAGLGSFVRAGIDTPAIIASEKLQNFGFITTEFLAESQSLDALWQSDLSDEKRVGLLKSVVETVAKLHQHNIIHKDPHLDNFLISEDKLFLIDGGGVHQESSPLSQQAALDNLAFFLSVLFPRHDHLSLKCIAAYQRIYPLEGLDEQSLAEAIWKKRKWRERYLEKVFRTCTDFVAESNFRHFQVVDRNEISEALTDFLATPDTYINTGQVLKRGTTNTVSIVTLNDGKKVFVKRYKSTKGVLHKYLRGIRKSRARNAWYVAHYLLRLLGIDTPKPLALLEHKFGCFVNCSYLVTEYVEADDAFHYFTQLQESSPEAEKRARSLLEMLRILKDGMVYHGDMKATNFMFSHDRHMVIDLDQTVILDSREKAAKYLRKDSERFSRNWVVGSVAAQLFK
ncbi:lipopolysaccharide core heptose(II) kinase RfaY [Endozoicomonas sp.]|uniref:lipopolysaccharide core heptose(II) kinase RfaY n=1 Tax=Endozoicomonas sp. TaxID=1892382 RepID=UPI00288518CF|nr:lipopolysaccharide core heptose(II) kinase RfaY [Endozoicomonas sp.]